MSHDRQVGDTQPIPDPIASPAPPQAAERALWVGERCKLTCACCGSAYDTPTRKRPACCREPHGMKTEVWLAQHCERCGKCPRHCQCEREPVQPVAVEGWRQIAEGSK